MVVTSERVTTDSTLTVILSVVLVDRCRDGVLRVAAFLRCTAAREQLPLDDPELCSVVKTITATTSVLFKTTTAKTSVLFKTTTATNSVLFKTTTATTGVLFKTITATTSVLYISPSMTNKTI